MIFTSPLIPRCQIHNPIKLFTNRPHDPVSDPYLIIQQTNEIITNSDAFFQRLTLW